MDQKNNSNDSVVLLSSGCDTVYVQTLVLKKASKLLGSLLGEPCTCQLNTSIILPSSPSSTLESLVVCFTQGWYLTYPRITLNKFLCFLNTLVLNSIWTQLNGLMTRWIMYTVIMGTNTVRIKRQLNKDRHFSTLKPLLGITKVGVQLNCASLKVE